MHTSRTDLPQKPLQMKKNDKLVSKHSSMEKSKNSSSSSESYHGGASVAIPFMWESQPGTPKHKSHEPSLPPLIPPPSYFSKTLKKPNKMNHSKPKLFHSVFPKLITLKKTHHPPSPPPSSPSPSSASSAYSVPSSPISTTPNFRGRVGLSGSRTSSDSSRIDEEEINEYGSPVSTLCFSAARGSNAGFRGGCSTMFKVLLGDST